MKKKQSSIDWFEARMLEILSPLNMVMSHEQWEMYDKAHEQAKAMHKEEIIKSWMAVDNKWQRIAAEKYYNETFGNETNKTIR